MSPIDQTVLPVSNLVTLSIGSNGVLVTWKEISEYVGWSARTLFRWEIQFGFPVHRPDPKIRARVVSTRREIDEWFRTRPLIHSKGKQQALLLPCARELNANAHRLRMLTRCIQVSAAEMRKNILIAMEITANRKKANYSGCPVLAR